MKMLATALPVPLLLVGSAARARTVEVGGPDYPTLAAAIAAVPRLSVGLREGEALELVLPPGVVRLSAAVVIGRAAGGRPGAPVVIRGAADGSTVLSGAIPVATRAAVAADAPGVAIPAGTLALVLAGVPGEVAPDRRGLQIPAPPTSLQLFQGRHWLAPSRWPATGYATGAASGSNAAGPRIAVPPAVAARWRSEPALWASGFWGADWEQERVPVVGSAGGQLRLAPLRAQQPVRAAVRFRIENAVSALTPGSVALLPARRLGLALPAAGGGGFEASVAPTLLRIEGAAHVAVTGIAFERSGGDALVIEAAQDVTIADCHVRDVGGNGIVVSGGEGVTIRDTIVSRIGERGVILGGGDRATLRPAGHGFVDGLVSDVGRLSPSYRPGVDLWGVGSRVTGSVIAGGDHAGMVVSGNDHHLLDNEIRDVLRDTEDAGAIYGGRDWTMRGLVVTGNYIHRLGAPARETTFLAGVYLDDQWSGATVTGNVVEGGDYAVVIGGGRDNLVEDNRFVAPRRGGVHVDARGLDVQAAMLGAFRASLAAVPSRSPAWRARYPALAALTPAQQGVPGGNLVRDNRLVGSAAPLLAGPAAAQALIAVGDNRPCKAMAACPPPARLVRRRVPRLQEKLVAWLR